MCCCWQDAPAAARQHTPYGYDEAAALCWDKAFLAPVVAACALFRGRCPALSWPLMLVVKEDRQQHAAYYVRACSLSSATVVVRLDGFMHVCIANLGGFTAAALLPRINDQQREQARRRSWYSIALFDAYKAASSLDHHAG